ncbi:DISARM system phospholipase D-like protein DrmC [Cyanobium sp. A2C-AMD]|uniref:DISARM system phospholipase D-like protein DrmC n=1 Tax=Cyanobium sp. A2C-AMD TaxID=2823695 RepID=UPI0020CECD47|nr:DISARM system phospholipase D-like protein DrmC [Cyanobium sp. A2C-AMD]MCP9876859.1 DISARM system phospholipase D-like protein DrmC [Cyanobium sp. A2C-AMD]
MAAAHDLLLAKAAQVACELSADQTEALAYEIGIAERARPILQVAGLAAPSSVGELCDLWVQDSTIDGARLAYALRCAARAVKTVSSYEKVELIYTGPDASSLRSTPQALLEVIRAARRKLWIVSYLMGPGMDPVLSAIHERSEAGVRVKLLIDHRHSSYAKTRFRLTQHAPAVGVFIWPDEKRQIEGGDFASLHAKCAVADGQRAFVSSANLAGYAMDHNLEVGYLVTGGSTPRILEHHLEELCRIGEIVAS